MKTNENLKQILFMTTRIIEWIKRNKQKNTKKENLYVPCLHTTLGPYAGFGTMLNVHLFSDDGDDDDVDNDYNKDNDNKDNHNKGNNNKQKTMTKT